MSEENSTILIVDDEPDIIELLAYNLTAHGFIVHSAVNGKEGIEKALEVLPDLIILDVMMPEMDGVMVCEELRSTPELKDVLITFLTARSEDFTQISCYEAGGDDFITKPIKPKVLISRLKALLKRRKSSSDQPVFTINDITIDTEKFQVHKDGEHIPFVKKEFKLLKLLTSRPGKVFSREEILNRIWESDVIVGDRTIDVHVRKLREKLGNDCIVTVKGMGYKFVTF